MSRSTTRMRHEGARRRTLRVAEKHFLTPNYLSIRFDCDDWEGFASASFDDHVKVFLAGERGEGGKPPMRDYTPRGFDPASGTFVIDFAMHDDAGPATAWARDCQVGDDLAIGGPRGSVMIGDGFDWYLLIGDEAAIPAISRCLEEWPDKPISVLVAVTSPDEEVPLPASAAHSITYVHRPEEAQADPATLLEALAQHDLPQGDGFAWIAAEAAVAKALRESVLEKGLPLERLKARGYWTAGAADTTARFD